MRKIIWVPQTEISRIALTECFKEIYAFEKLSLFPHKSSYRQLHFSSPGERMLELPITTEKTLNKTVWKGKQSVYFTAPVHPSAHLRSHLLPSRSSSTKSVWATSPCPCHWSGHRSDPDPASLLHHSCDVTACPRSPCQNAKTGNPRTAILCGHVSGTGTQPQHRRISEGFHWFLQGFLSNSRKGSASVG